MLANGFQSGLYGLSETTEPHAQNGSRNADDDADGRPLAWRPAADAVAAVPTVAAVTLPASMAAATPDATTERPRLLLPPRKFRCDSGALATPNSSDHG